MLRFLVMFALIVLNLPVNDPCSLISKEEIHERLRNAFIERPDSWHVVCKTQSTWYRKNITPEEQKLELWKLENEYRERFANGTLKLDPETKETLQERYGTSDLKKINSNPEVKSRFEALLSEMLQERKGRLVEEGKTIKFTDIESIYFDRDKGLRLESNRLEYKKGNTGLERGDYFESEIRVINPSIQKRYFKDRNFGEIHPGFDSDNANLYSPLSVSSMDHAGKSVASRAIQLEYLVSAEFVDTSEGPGIQLVYHYEWKPGSGMLYFTTILPEKAYSVYEEKKYANGRIHLHDIYDNYKEISPGIWYAMHQKNTTVPSANLPAGIQDKLSAGELTFLSPEVLQSQIYEMHQITERWIEKVELDILIDNKQFTFDFPPSITIKDYTKRNDDVSSYE